MAAGSRLMRESKDGAEAMVEADKGESPDDRWVRVMCDYGAGGLWVKSGEAIWPIDLPVSNETRDRLAKWQDWFEECPPDGRPSQFDVVAFSAEGLAIAKAIKAELPHWTVIYHDESRRGPVRQDCEYEVGAL